MLSNQILHKTAQDIREITGFDCAIWDMQGFCLVRTNETLTGYEIQIQDFRDDEEEPEEMILDEMGMFRIYEDSDPVYVLMLMIRAEVELWQIPQTPDAHHDGEEEGVVDHHPLCLPRACRARTEIWNRHSLGRRTYICQPIRHAGTCRQSSGRRRASAR